MAVSAISGGGNSAMQQLVSNDQRAEEARQTRREEQARRERESDSATQQAQQSRQAAQAEQERQTQQADAVRRQQLEAQQNSQNSTRPAVKAGQTIDTTA
jgi:hypothetical protein